ncbi:MAG: GTP-binding protein [Candidatus Moranbacteria bacterium]|nr:GTP-binding protein [Candidatus Moranbacteria bacterium]
MQSPPFSAPSKQNTQTQKPLHETKNTEDIFPRVYRQPKSSWSRLKTKIQTLIAKLRGRPDPNRIVPVTIFTGFLGAGKTTVIINLMKQLPRQYHVAWLKNEFGNTAVDSELAQDNNIATVKEMLQGCICHVLIGQLGQAIEEILTSDPDRIIIETSGSATPAPIVWEIRKHPRLSIDAVVTVVDAINFPGYKDKSYTAKLQAKHTDLILINKHEEVSEIELDKVLDDIYELNLKTPKIKTDKGHVDPKLLFELDSQLFKTLEEVNKEESHITHNHQYNEVELIEISFEKKLSKNELKATLSHLPKENFYRIKGVMLVDNQTCILNWAFGRFQISPIKKKGVRQSKIVFMGDDIRSFQTKIKEAFAVTEKDLVYTPKQNHKSHKHHSH